MDTGELFAYSWHIDEDEKSYTVIRIYGLNDKNETVCISVKNFKPYVFVQLPDDIVWDDGKASSVVNKINTMMETQEGDYRPEKIQLMHKKRLYYADVNSKMERKMFPYLCLTFQHADHIQTLVKKLRYPIYVTGISSKPLVLKVHEANASPILQLTSLRKLPTAGWIKFAGKKINLETQHSRCKYEYNVKWKDLEPKESDVVARPYLLSFDIEVYSHIYNVMPSPQADEDAIFQISCVFSRQGSKQYEKYLLTLGEADEKACGEDVKVISYKLEYELLEGFVDLIQEKQPNIIMGYNIFGFDLPQMYARAEYIGARKFKKQGFNRFGDAKEKLIEWSSSAYKNQSFRFLDAEGRLYFDLLPQVRRLLKLSSYSLKAISSHVLKNATKDPLDAKGIFKCYEIGIMKNRIPVIPSEKSRRAVAFVGKYCVQDSFLVTQLFETMTMWIALCEMSKVTGVPIFSLYTQGQQLKAFSQVYRKCTHENIVVEKDAYKTLDNDHYVGAIVFVPEPGVYEKVVSFDFCLGGSTLITTSNGCNERLDQIVTSSVFSKDDHGLVRKEIVHGLQVKGEKETVKIWLQDGTTIVSTPDHKFMLFDGRWVEAKDLKGEYICSGLEYPEDKRDALEKDWSLCIGDIVFDMKENRNKSLAFARILGFLLATDYKPHFETAIDATMFINDLNLLPPLVEIRSVYKSSKLPLFLLDRKCPFAVIREFLGGVFGGGNSFDFAFKDIGFRYSVNKSYRLTLLCSYQRMQDFVQDCPSLESYLKETKTIQWFKDERFIRPNDTHLPTYRRKVIDVCPNGLEKVYDIEVTDTHNFIANGVIAHNCSLYPTTIIAYNICWSTLVRDDTVPDSLCHVMEWEDHIGCVHDPKEIRKTELTNKLKVHEDELKELRRQRVLKTNKNRQEEFKLMIEEFVEKIRPLREERAQLKKGKGKHIICAKRKYRWIKTPKGVLPEILSNLLDTRSATKKEMKKVKAKLEVVPENTKEHQEISTYYDVLDQRQLELKISANSGYGCMGVRKGYLPFMPGAMCTTYMGRQAIEKAAKSIQTDYKGKLIYGDSVSADTPVLLRDKNGNIVVRTIDTINQKWKPYNEFKPFDSNRKEKEQSETEFEVWTHKGWSRIRRVIRHKTQKRMYRVLTSNGIVDVTEDHSLLTDKEKKIKPNQLCIGASLLHSSPIDLSNFKPRTSDKDKVNMQQEYIRLKKLGCNPVVQYDDDVCTIVPFGSYSNSVKKVIELPSVDDTYVYDLETEQGVFQAGIGEMIVKNTDSNYVSFPHLESVADCWDFSVKVANEVSKLYPRPMSLAFEEKIFMKFLIITKKRYMCLSCARDGKVGDKISNKGVLLTRRDSCPFIRKVYSEVVMMIFNRANREEIADYVLTELNKLCSHFYSADQFVVTKSVGSIGDLIPQLGKDKEGKECYKVGDYKVTPLPDDRVKRERKMELKECNNEKDYYLNCLPAQVQLAEKMRQRGQMVPAGSRLEYVITDQCGHLEKQSKKVESYDYFVRHNESMRIDHLYYLKLLTKPLDQILDIVFNNPKEKGFVLKQYKYRLQVRRKVTNQIQRFGMPKLKFEP